MWTYVLKLPSGEQVTVRDIAIPPTQYASMLASGWTIVSYQTQAQTYPIYRLIIETSPGRVDTGATLPGCSIDHPENCNPRQFSNTPDAFAYAASRNEIPVIVPSADEAWAIVDAENRARQLQTQYTGPSASPAPLPGQGGPLPSDGGIVATLEANPVLAVIGAYALYRLMKR